MSEKLLCEGHLSRSGEKIPAEIIAGGMPLCAPCFFGETFTHSWAFLNPWHDPRLRPKMLEAVRRSAADAVRNAKLSESMKRRLADPEVRLAYGRRMTERPESRAKIAQRMREAWQRPDARAHMAEEHSKSVMANPELRAAISERLRKFWSDPEWKARLVDNMKRSMNSEPVVEKLRAAANSQWSDPEMRKRMIEGMKRAARKRLKLADAAD